MQIWAVKNFLPYYVIAKKSRLLSHHIMLGDGVTKLSTSKDAGHHWLRHPGSMRPSAEV
jgi:hypothetical protein